MRCPSEPELALYAGGDLGRLQRWCVARHLARCEDCRAVAESFADLRADLADLTDLPGLPWDRLEAEMKANIRLGLEAGACVRRPESPPRRPRARALIACATASALLVAVVAIQQSRLKPAAAPAGVELGVTANGIQLRDGDAALTLLNSGAQDVTYSAGAQGAMRARYIDSETGQVTIHNVYVE